MALARRCDDLNRQRRDLCDAIEAEAIALVESDAEGRIHRFCCWLRATGITG